LFVDYIGHASAKKTIVNSINQFPVIDLFAGPGGLGEGFSSFKPAKANNPFRIALSVEKEAFAHRTLRLRAFVRAAEVAGRIPQSYYDYVKGEAETPYTEKSRELWEQAEHEARCLEIGEADTEKLHGWVKSSLGNAREWVLIGGPPCQAYSLVGRARNAGNTSYRAENDGRHFLYKHYLELIRKFHPTVFVMENVKGLLSSKVKEEGVFGRILSDLHDPGQGAMAPGKSSPKYRIFSVATGDVFEGASSATLDPRSFIVATEKFGIPQNRHRVILVGVREDVDSSRFKPLVEADDPVSVRAAIGDMPRLRSGLSKGDSDSAWVAAVAEQARRAEFATKRHFLGGPIRESILNTLEPLSHVRLPQKGRGGRAIPLSRKQRSTWAEQLADAKLDAVLNHETRNHMSDDFARYLFCSAYGLAEKYSPRARHFPPDLAPSHSSWLSGFADRFRVQLEGEPATTITCHIHKDGHYYIHPEPDQCRTLTVREAARLQTFPDNYFFEGSRTEQYIQVGNAVPPLLAGQIAELIWKMIKT
jgi:DNA (cytosine-5)-methyltransferase 1